jgi:glycerophosphoryl diester phosphodiesterase
MSFDPRIGQWFNSHAPEIVRGLVVTQEQDKGIWRRLRGSLFRRQALRMAAPDFLALDIRDLPSALSRRARAKGLPVLTWTVQSPKEERVAVDHADEMIFEQPGPGTPKGLVE